MPIKIIKNMDEFSDAFDTIGDRMLIINFCAEWCAKCKATDPQLQKLATAYEREVLFIKVDVDKFEDLSERYDVKKVPTFVYIRDRKTIDVTTGSTVKKTEDCILKHISVE